MFQHRLQIVIPEDKSYRLDNVDGTSSEVVGIVASGHADLGLNLFEFLKERMDVIDFLNPIGKSR
jgi:hypothetical protein